MELGTRLHRSVPRVARFTLQRRSNIKDRGARKVFQQTRDRSVSIFFLRVDVDPTIWRINLSDVGSHFDSTLRENRSDFLLPVRNFRDRPTRAFENNQAQNEQV